MLLSAAYTAFIIGQRMITLKTSIKIHADKPAFGTGDWSYARQNKLFHVFEVALWTIDKN